MEDVCVGLGRSALVTQIGERGGLGEENLVEVAKLIRCPAANEVRLRPPRIAVLEQDLHGWVRRRHSLGDGDLLVDVAAGLLVDGLELVLGRDGPVEDVLLQAGDGVVGGPHALDLLTGSVSGAGVRHTVATVTVCDVLEHHRAVAVLGPLLSVLDRGLDRQDIHAVNLQSGDVLATLVVIRQGRRTGRGGTHTVLVVYRDHD